MCDSLASSNVQHRHSLDSSRISPSVRKSGLRDEHLGRLCWRLVTNRSVRVRGGMRLRNGVIMQNVINFFPRQFARAAAFCDAAGGVSKTPTRGRSRGRGRGRGRGQGRGRGRGAGCLFLLLLLLYF